LRSLLNIFKFGTLSFQYISHRVLRWTLTPLLLLCIIPINLILALNAGMQINNIYTLFFYGQVLFYVMALTGWFLENRKIKIKALFVPYYFFIMNLSVFLGLRRYLKGNQSVKWQRAQRGK
jgi:hypothetical protein